MPTNLTRLDVSLTKHGAHKLALLLKKYDKDNIVPNLWGVEPGVNIETAQAEKNLSVTNGVVPSIWNKVRALGDEAIDALVFISIVFSHHRLISSMKEGASVFPFTGTITRDKQLDGKAYTNFAHTIEQLGFSTEHTKSYIHYNLSKIFEVKGLNVLAKELFAIKLKAAKWDETTTLEAEVIANEFHKVFAISEERFLGWLGTGTLPSEKSDVDEDLDFFFDADDEPTGHKFQFSPGHTDRKIGTVDVAAKATASKMSLLHNQIQNELFAQLVLKYGKDCVGTEIPTGHGTSIDVVVKTKDCCTFYEIKTAPSVKACIRQAIPQLLEYAYWPGERSNADVLVIVAPHAITPEADSYLKYLQEKFKLRMEYMQFKPSLGPEAY